MIAFARLLVRVLGFLALVKLAAAGIVLALFCIGTGTSGPSLGRLAALLALPSVRESVGSWLASLESSGSVAVVAGLCGIGAILLGLVLLAGILVPRRDRLVTLARSDHGRLAARRRPLAQLATALVEQVRGVAQVRVRVRPGRAAGGRLAVRASRTRPSDPQHVHHGIREQLRGLTDPFKLKLRASVTLPRRARRVE